MASTAHSSSLAPTDHTDLPPVKDSLLHLAALVGDIAKVRQCLSQGDDVDALSHLDVNGTLCTISPLWCATMQGHDKVVEALLSAHATVDKANYEGFTALMTAARYGHEKCVLLLLQAGADLTKMNYVTGYAALHCGAERGSVAVVRTLLSWGADVNSTGKSLSGDELGVSALHVGAQHGNVDVIPILLDAGAAIEGTDKEGRTALRHAAYSGFDQVVEVLISAGATLDTADCQLFTPLMCAARAGAEKCVQPLLKAGADVLKTGGKYGSNALHSAASSEKDDVVSILLRWGAHVDAVDVRGRTALFVAAFGGHSKTIRRLLDAGADPHIRTRQNATALMCAKDLPTVKLLLEAGVSATAADKFGNSVLHHMGRRGDSTAVICAVFKAGANPTLLNNAGKTAAQLARGKGHDDAAKLLDMLAAKYTQTENSCLEANEKPSSVASVEEVAELDVKMKAACVSDTNDEIDVECSQDVEEGQKPRVVRPCLNCQTLTHRRCARCRTAYICSRDCQVATLAEHRVECMEIYEQRERAKEERKAAGWKDESG